MGVGVGVEVGVCERKREKERVAAAMLYLIIYILPHFSISHLNLFNTTMKILSLMHTATLHSV